MSSRSLARHVVEQFGGYCLGQRVVALFFPPGYHIVAVAGYHAVHFGQLVGRVLQVGVHSEYDIAACGPETCP